MNEPDRERVLYELGCQEDVYERDTKFRITDELEAGTNGLSPGVIYDGIIARGRKGRGVDWLWFIDNNNCAEYMDPGCAQLLSPLELLAMEADDVDA